MNREICSVLLADHDSQALLTLSACLTALGYDVTSAATGREAIDAMAARDFDVIITDLLMPDGDGMEVIMAVRQLRPEAGIIAMSGDGDYFEGSQLLKTARLLGADALLEKPFTRAQLLDALERAMPGRIVVAA